MYHPLGSKAMPKAADAVADGSNAQENMAGEGAAEDSDLFAWFDAASPKDAQGFGFAETLDLVGLDGDRGLRGREKLPDSPRISDVFPLLVLGVVYFEVNEQIAWE